MFNSDHSIQQSKWRSLAQYTKPISSVFNGISVDWLAFNSGNSLVK